MNDIKSTSTTCLSPPTSSSAPSPCSSSASPSSSSSSSSSSSPLPSSSSCNAAAKSNLTTRITLKKLNTVEKKESAFTSLNSSSLYRTLSLNANAKDNDCYISNFNQSPASSLKRNHSHPLDSNEAYSFTEVEDANLKYDFSTNNTNSLQSDMEPSNCSKPTITKSETMDTSLRTSDGLYKCRICKRLFANRYSLTGHYKSHYEPSQKPYCCDDCGQRYTSPSNLHYHRGRNCPVLKLKAIKEGKLIPTSVQNTKLLELKALRAVERKAFMNKLKDNNDANNNNEAKNSSGEVKRHHQSSAGKRSRLSTCKSVDDDCVTTLKTDSSIKCPRENKMAKSQNSPSITISPRPSSNNNTGNNVNDIGNMVQENESGLQMQEIVRLFLMHAYQSDELRQQLLSLTSNALLNALLPTNGFNSNLFVNQNPTSNQQLFNLISNFISSNFSTEKTINTNHPHDSIHAIHMQQKSTIGTPSIQPNCIGLSMEEPTDLTSTACNYIQQSSQSNSSGIQSPNYRQDSHIFQHIHELNKHPISIHSKYLRCLSVTTSEAMNFMKPLTRCHSLNETIPSNSDWDMKITNSTSTTPNLLLQQHYRQHQRQQEQEQPINYSENLSNQNYTSSGGNANEQSSSPSVIPQWNHQPSSLVSCTDCDREFSSYTAFRVHHTKSHQQATNQRKSTAQRNSTKSQSGSRNMSTSTMN
ncbi:unnamed protein product [Schistosoma turkestanicum]|nr:unnamed protein product [Schistosoma turkestanicum]